MFAERLVEQARTGGQISIGHDNIDAVVAEDAQAATRRVLARVIGTHHHAADPGPTDGARARRRAPVVAARLERDVQSRARQIVPARGLDRFDLGVGRAGGPVKALGEGLDAQRDHRTDHRVG